MVCDTRVLKALVAMEILLDGLTKAVQKAAPLSANDNEIVFKSMKVKEKMVEIHEAIETEKHG